jgi:hypothetical protein
VGGFGRFDNDGGFRAARVAVLYFALTLLLAYPLTMHPVGRVLSASPDVFLMMWALMWDTHAFTHQPLSIFEANIYYPQHDTLAYSENFIGSAVFAAPVLWLTGNPVLAMNVVWILSCVLCGVGAYFLSRRLGVGPPGATLAGLIFAFSPPRFLRLGQLHLATVQWMPFALAFLHSYLDGGRKFDLRMAAAFFTMQALSTGHGAVFLTIAMLGLITYRVALGEPVALIRRLRDLGVTGALLLAPAVLIVLPYRRVQVDMGLRRWLIDWGRPWTSFLASPAHLQAFLLSFWPESRVNETAWAYLFPGYLPLLLGAAAVLLVGRSAPKSHVGRRVVWTRTALALEAAALACLVFAAYGTAVGPIRVRIADTLVFSARNPWRAWLFFAAVVAARVAIARRAPFVQVNLRLRRGLEVIQRWAEARRQDATTFYALLTLVSIWLAAGAPGGLWPHVFWLPGMNFIRVPSRFMVLAMLGIAVLAGMGYERLSARFAPKRSLVVATLVGALLVAEFAAMPLYGDEYRVEIPAVDRWLDGQPKPFAIAEVPLPDPRNTGGFERRHTAYMFHSTAHWQKTIHGYSGLRPQLHFTLFNDLAQFPNEASLSTLVSIGVRYVVVHTDYYAPGEWAAVDARLGLFREWLKLEHVDGAGRVYSLVRRTHTPADRPAEAGPP